MTQNPENRLIGDTIETCEIVRRGTAEMMNKLDSSKSETAAKQIAVYLSNERKLHVFQSRSNTLQNESGTLLQIVLEQNIDTILVKIQELLQCDVIVKKQSLVV